MRTKQLFLPALTVGALTLSTIAAYAKGPAPVTVTLKNAQGADVGTAVLKQEKADVLLKATKVEGIYDADPVIKKDAVKFEQITYMEILRLGLKVMDSTAVSLCKDNNLPMIIFNMNRPGNILRVVSGEKVGSLVTA